MNILIIEDEIPASEKLVLFLKRYDPQINIMAITGSVAKSIAYLKEHETEIDLIFQDIQLTDGLSFEIFKHIEVKAPIIFTTAFNEHALEAFKVNSIDYLLKPISFEDLVNSMKKIDVLRQQLKSGTKPESNMQGLLNLLNESQNQYRSRFLVKIGDHIKSVPVKNICAFYAEGRNAFIQTNENRKFNIDFRLEELTHFLNPHIFMRVNRSYIVNINYIGDVIAYSNSRLKIKTQPESDKEIIVSREKVNQFKEWYAGNLQF